MKVANGSECGDLAALTRVLVYDAVQPETKEARAHVAVSSKSTQVSSSGVVMIRQKNISTQVLWDHEKERLSCWLTVSLIKSAGN